MDRAATRDLNYKYCSAECSTDVATFLAVHNGQRGVANRTVTVRVCLPFAIGTVVLISLDLAGYHVNSSTA